MASRYEALCEIVAFQQGTGSRQDAERPLGSAGRGDLGQAVERGCSAICVIAAGRRLDQLRIDPGRQPQFERMLRGSLGRDQCLFVAAERVEEDGTDQFRPHQKEPLTTRRDVAAAGVDQRASLRLAAAPGGAQKRDVRTQTRACGRGDGIRLLRPARGRREDPP